MLRMQCNEAKRCRTAGKCEAANSDDLRFGGSGVLNGVVETEPVSTHGYDQSVELNLPPLGAVFFVPSA